MYRKNSVDFVNRFIDSVTIRPFLMDLRRMRRASQRFPMPTVQRPATSSTEAA
jgi:hypothetical protein